MRKVSSAPNLAGLDARPSLPAPPRPSLLGAGAARKAPPRGETSVAHALFADASAPAPPPPPASLRATDAEVAYIIASRGLAQASECLANLEMDEAPDLVGDSPAVAEERLRARALDAASCLAAPVVPDRNAAEIVQRRVDRIESRAEGELRLRFAAEVGAVRPAGPHSSWRSLRRGGAGGRRRSVDDLDRALARGGGAAAAAPGAAAPGGAGAPSPEARALLEARGALCDAARRSTLRLDEAPAPPPPAGDLLPMAEPDHAYLVGGSSASLASLDVPSEDGGGEGGGGSGGSGGGAPPAFRAARLPAAAANAHNIVPFHARPLAAPRKA